MKKRLALLTTAAFLFSWILSGCFQTETWTTITGNGGMERKVDIQIKKDSKFLLMEKKSLFEKDGWKVTEEEKDTIYHLIAEKKFDDANAFKSPFGEAQIKLEKKDGKFFYTEIFDAKKVSGISDTNKSDMIMQRFLWSQLKYTFHLTMPSKIEKSSAGKIDGKKATWEFNADAVFDQGTFTMTAESAEAGGLCGSTIFVSGIGLTLLLLGIKLGYDRFMAYRRRRLATE